MPPSKRNLGERARVFNQNLCLAVTTYEACDIEPQTIAGVLIQARALTAYAEAEIEAGHYRGGSGQLVGLALAQSLTRLSA
jgi:hypothetical protein